MGPFASPLPSQGHLGRADSAGLSGIPVALGPQFDFREFGEHVGDREVRLARGEPLKAEIDVRKAG